MVHTYSQFVVFRFLPFPCYVNHDICHGFLVPVKFKEMVPITLLLKLGAKGSQFDLNFPELELETSFPVESSTLTDSSRSFIRTKNPSPLTPFNMNTPGISEKIFGRVAWMKSVRTSARNPGRNPWKNLAGRRNPCRNSWGNSGSNLWKNLKRNPWENPEGISREIRKGIPIWLSKGIPKLTPEGIPEDVSKGRSLKEFLKESWEESLKETWKNQWKIPGWFNEGYPKGMNY